MTSVVTTLRPLAVDRTDPRWREVLSRRPGITDWASVEYFDEEAVLARAADPRRAYREEVLPRKLDLQLRYVRDPAEAEDIAQEAFIKAYRALPRFRGDSAFYTWLYRIAINTAKNALAARGRSPLSFEIEIGRAHV